MPDRLKLRDVKRICGTDNIMKGDFPVDRLIPPNSIPDIDRQVLKHPQRRTYISISTNSISEH